MRKAPDYSKMTTAKLVAEGHRLSKERADAEAEFKARQKAVADILEEREREERGGE